MYEAAFWIDGASSGGLDAAMFGTTGRFYGERKDSDGSITESWSVDLDKRSLPRSGDAILETLRVSRKKTVRGTVVASTGRRDISKGQRCSYSVSPVAAAGFLPAQSSTCEAKIECDGHVLYHGESECLFDEALEPVYEDLAPSPLDGDARVGIEGAALTITDIELTGPWKVTIYLDEAPSYADSE